MSFMEDIQKETKQYGVSGNNNFFQFKKGVNKMRLLVQPKILATHFFQDGKKPTVCVGVDNGCKFHGESDKRPSIKLVTYVIDRDDKGVKLAELPLSISYALNDLQEDSDFAFSEFPMPYDVKITHDPDNDDPKAKYRLVASPKQEPLTEEEKVALAEAMKKITPEQYVEKRKEKVGNTKSNMTPAFQGDEYPQGPNIDDIPF